LQKSNFLWKCNDLHFHKKIGLMQSSQLDGLENFFVKVQVVQLVQESSFSYAPR
jgi:hypothetical protein